ncbi:MAG: lipocalin-like domain-containing protein [Pseudomonadota bacterium]
MTEFTRPFFGVWEIDHWTVTDLEKNEETEFFDGQYAGNIIYTETGWVSASLMDTRRPPVSNDRGMRYAMAERVATQGAAGLTDQQYEYLAPFILMAFGYVGYMGTFEADAEQVYHQTKTAGRPNHAGVTLPRFYTFADDEHRLTLWADAFGWRDTLVWTRVI